MQGGTVLIYHGNQVQDGPKKSVFDFAVYLGLYDGIHWGGCKVSSILCTVECLLIQCHVPASFAYFKPNCHAVITCLN